jgi:hypothetical protein
MKNVYRRFFGKITQIKSSTDNRPRPTGCPRSTALSLELQTLISLLTGEKADIHSKLNQRILTLPLRLGGLPAVGRFCATYFF